MVLCKRSCFFAEKNYMANLTFIQKQLIEDVFGMAGGYFLDFNNREFSEYMKDVVGYDIYEKYPGLSKAKIFRAFYQDEEDRFVGKAIVLAINYMKEKGMDERKPEETNRLYKLGKTLLGVNKEVPTGKKDQPSDAEVRNIIDYSEIQKRLIAIENEATSQKKGYAFEKFLVWLFNLFNLEPRTAYKTDSDQIDGSFQLGDFTVLMEAKYQKKVKNKDDLILFNDKLEHKSTSAKGLFISYSQVSDNALSYFSNHGARMTILYTHEIFQMCLYQADLKKILKAKFRHLDETGCIWYPVDISTI